MSLMGVRLLKRKIGRAIRTLRYHGQLKVAGAGILILLVLSVVIASVIAYGPTMYFFGAQALSRAWAWGTNAFGNACAALCGLSIDLEDSRLILQKGYPILYILEKDTMEDDTQPKSLGDMLKDVLSTLTGMDLSTPRTLLRSEVRYLSSVRDMPFTVSRSYSYVERVRSPETPVTPVLFEQGLRLESGEGKSQVAAAEQANVIRRIRELADPSDNRNDKLGIGGLADIATVGVYYTHTSESFMSMSGVTHTQGTCGDIVMIGRELIKRLENNYGIKVAYSETIHDYPNWSRAYTNALQTALALVRDNPSLKVLLDIHRDGFDDDVITPDQAKKIVTANINGVNVARIMIVVTTDDFGLAHPNWRSNYEFAVKLNNKMNEMYPGLSRGIDVRKDARFNQHVHERALLLEIGAYVSEEEELRRSAAMLADVIAAISREI